MPKNSEIIESLNHRPTAQTRDSITDSNIVTAESEHVGGSLQWLTTDIPTEPSELHLEGTTAVTPCEKELGASDSFQSVSTQPVPKNDFPQPESNQESEGPSSPSLHTTALLRSPSRRPEPSDDVIANIECAVHDDGVICLLPTNSQWKDFPAIIERARELGAGSIGACKIVLPEGMAGPRAHASDSNRPSYSYHTKTRTNGTVSVKMTLEDFGFQNAPATLETIEGPAIVYRLEQLIKDDSSLKDVRYRTDMDARTTQERQGMGMPSSSIWPLEGDRLRETRLRVPGIHWPYAYEANNAFGAMFAMHREDWDLFSINHLYEGTKTWIIVSGDFSDLLEQKVRESDPTFGFSNCDQVLRHYSTYIPSLILDEWKIPYKVICQMSGEIVLTFPRAYHQGCSAGPTFAEAVNYADKTWSVETYKECDPRRCPKGFITREMMEVREKDTDQQSVADTDSIENEQAAPCNITVPSIIGDSSKPPRRGVNWKYVKKAKAPVKPSESRKRKPATQIQEPISKKFARVELSPGRELSTILKDVVASPTMQADAVYQEFAKKSSDPNKELNHSRIELLTRLFFAIASPDAFCQLRDACHSVRHNLGSIPQLGGNIAETMKALDNLETTVNMASTVRRYYLVSLVALRSQRQSKYTQQRLRQSRTVGEENEVSLRPADSQALTSMMAEAYPDLNPVQENVSSGRDEYEKKRRSLQNRLVAGQKWLMMEKEFSSGILALVPMQGDYELSNTQ